MSESFWAYNAAGGVVMADETHYGMGPFYCHCGKKHKMKLSKPSGLPGRRPFSPYFAHCVTKDRTNEQHCGNRAGESDKHMLAKKLLQTHIGMYSFVVTRCRYCRQAVDVIHTETTDRVDIEVIDYCITNTRRWRYDCCLYRGNSLDFPIACMEVCNTSKCNVQKVHDLDKRKLPLVEFDVDTVLSLYQINRNKKLELENKLEKLGTCNACQKRIREKEERQRQLEIELAKQEKERQEKERLENEKKRQLQIERLRQRELELQILRETFKKKNLNKRLQKQKREKRLKEKIHAQKKKIITIEDWKNERARIFQEDPDSSKSKLEDTNYPTSWTEQFLLYRKACRENNQSHDT